MFNAQNLHDSVLPFKRIGPSGRCDARVVVLANESRDKMTPKEWIFDLNSGGEKIPPTVKADVQDRLFGFQQTCI